MPGSETALPSRGWCDDLCYGTGTAYLSGYFISITSLDRVLRGTIWFNVVDGVC